MQSIFRVPEREEMSSYTRILEAVLSHVEPFTIVDICREAKAWPSEVRFQIEEGSISGGLFCTAGKTVPNAKGDYFVLYKIASDKARQEIERKKAYALAVNRDKPDSDYQMEDILEPPLGFRSALDAMLRGDPILLPSAESDVEWGRANPMTYYDDSLYAEHASALYCSLVDLSMKLWKKELGLDNTPEATLCAGFQQVAGKLVLLGKWHTDCVSELAGRWRNSPVLKKFFQEEWPKAN